MIFYARLFKTKKNRLNVRGVLFPIKNLTFDIKNTLFETLLSTKVSVDNNSDDNIIIDRDHFLFHRILNLFKKIKNCKLMRMVYI